MSTPVSPSTGTPSPSPSPSWRTRPRARWIAAAVAVVVGVVVAVVVSTAVSRPACGCAIPTSDDSSVQTAQRYVAALADPTSSTDIDLTSGAERPDAARAASLARLADPATTWVVVATDRHGNDYGRSPATRHVVGIAPDGHVDGVVVQADDDYTTGSVDPALTTAEAQVDVIRGGATPILAQPEEATNAAMFLVRPGSGAEPLGVVDGHDVDGYAYLGPGLQPGSYVTIASRGWDDDLVVLTGSYDVG